MSAKVTRRWFYLLERQHFDDMTAHDAIDILRYDGARPECNPPTGHYLFSTAATHGPNLERMRSYHLVPVWSAVCDADCGSSRAWEWFHDRAREAM